MSRTSFNVHPSADVQTAMVGTNTTIWQYVVILKEARIGANVNICSHCFIENDVSIGDNVTIKCGVQIWDGVTIEDGVFIGPNVTFTNDKTPVSKDHSRPAMKTVIRRNASIGGGAVILPGLTIGAGARIGAGAVVTKSIPDNSLAYGNPAMVVTS
jgi:acetyltransferase-like isoleucine patch superfamily enzyme